MRPDVALAFDRMAAAARGDGISLIVNSGYRSDAEQAELYARHPDPKWVAPPGKSLHRLGTELDLGPPSAYALARAQRGPLPLRSEVQLGAVALRLHPQSALNPRHAPWCRAARRRPQRHSVVRPCSIRAPDRASRRPLERLRCAARRPAVCGVELQPIRHQRAGGTRHRPVHARHRAPLRSQRPVRSRRRDQRSSPPDARPAAPLSARSRWRLPRYNAGAGAVGRCGCVPPYRETQAYVARILGLMGGAGASLGGAGSDGDSGALEVHLVS